MEKCELITVSDLEPGNLVLLRDGEIVEVRNAVSGEYGWLPMTLYRRDEVSKALVQADARVARFRNPSRP